MLELFLLNIVDALSSEQTLLPAKLNDTGTQTDNTTQGQIDKVTGASTSAENSQGKFNSHQNFARNIFRTYLKTYHSRFAHVLNILTSQSKYLKNMKRFVKNRSVNYV